MALFGKSENALFKDKFGVACTHCDEAASPQAVEETLRDRRIATGRDPDPQVRIAQDNIVLIRCFKLEFEEAGGRLKSPYGS